MADAMTVLSELVIGGLMGVFGQGLRTIVGLKKTSDEAVGLGLYPAALFRTGRLLTSLLIAFVVGIGAALAIGLGNLIVPDGNPRSLLSVAAAGYVGTDFIEGFVAQYTIRAQRTRMMHMDSIGLPNFDPIFKIIDDAQRGVEVQLSWAGRQMLAIPVFEQFQDRGFLIFPVVEESVRKILQRVRDDRNESSRTRFGESNAISVIGAFAHLFCNIPPFCEPTEEERGVHERSR